MHMAGGGCTCILCIPLGTPLPLAHLAPNAVLSLATDALDTQVGGVL
jgi:hypothetical protein